MNSKVGKKQITFNGKLELVRQGANDLLYFNKNEINDAINILIDKIRNNTVNDHEKMALANYYYHKIHDEKMTEDDIPKEIYDFYKSLTTK